MSAPLGPVVSFKGCRTLDEVLLRARNEFDRLAADRIRRSITDMLTLAEEEPDIDELEAVIAMMGAALPAERARFLAQVEAAARALADRQSAPSSPQADLVARVH